jgi:transcriptional regulator of acetoin/glycerol metabolism
MAFPKRTTSYVTHPKDQRRIAKLWEGFHTRRIQKDDLTDPYERMLFAEWERAERLGVSPTMREAIVLPQAELDRVLQKQSFLVDKARGALDRVQQALRGIPGILIFADAGGTILYVAGDPSVRRKAANYNLVEGGRWGEAETGTNGIGTAIAKKALVHVYSSEHFVDGWHIWTCAAAPVLDPVTDEVLGVVDFTTFASDFRPGAADLSASVAGNIAEELRVQTEMEHLQLAHYYSVYSAEFPSEAVLVYDRMGRLVRHTPGVNPEEFRPSSEDLTVLRQAPTEVRQLLMPSTRTPIGTLVVTPVGRVGLTLGGTSPAPPEAAARQSPTAPL